MEHVYWHHLIDFLDYTTNTLLDNILASP